LLDSPFPYRKSTTRGVKADTPPTPQNLYIDLILSMHYYFAKRRRCSLISLWGIMKKLCVFCGEEPVSKNMEHVIPLWLIKYTGDPGRKVPLGIDWNTGKLREYSFDQLEFPACGTCNSKFSALESQAKNVILNILDEQCLSTDALSIFLSWLDKVRIGLWLGFLFLNKNIFGIDPHFYIASRLDRADRMVLIYKSSDTQKGVQFTGVGTPLFDHCPSCFGITINQFSFINISSDFLFSRRLGLPYPSEAFLTDTGQISFEMQPGKNRIIFPLIRKPYNKTCTELFQPIIRPELMIREEMKALYQTNYVKNYFDINHSLLGKVLLNYNNKIVDYSITDGKRWIPHKVHDRDTLGKIIAREIISFHEFLLDNLPSFDQVELQYRQFWKQFLSKLRKFNLMMLKKIEKEL
jgi:hypothetical protein